MASFAWDYAHRARGSMGREPRPSVRLRLRVWWHRGELDRLLAEGANPLTEEERALRACQLTAPRARESFASGIRHTIAAATQPASLRGRTVPLNSEQVRQAQTELRALEDALSRATDPPPRGVAIVSFLLCDGSSPLYDQRCPVTVAELARTARAALERPNPWHG